MNIWNWQTSGQCLLSRLKGNSSKQIWENPHRKNVLFVPYKVPSLVGLCLFPLRNSWVSSIDQTLPCFVLVGVLMHLRSLIFGYVVAYIVGKLLDFIYRLWLVCVVSGISDQPRIFLDNPCILYILPIQTRQWYYQVRKKFSGDNVWVIMIAYYICKYMRAALIFSKFCVSLCN